MARIHSKQVKSDHTPGSEWTASRGADAPAPSRPADPGPTGKWNALQEEPQPITGD
ncbi:hypothetical protein PENSUB_2581 [Penicillium subrubescens]|uniref:Uncharacterized protein n=1 Tax=Penicillium subrubescens TaxID=1316194 RepID=A0A1Q5UHG6_9EURO|nr:hypothetical protein PENSUB_2581 [Penicillium subrubescens]